MEMPVLGWLHLRGRARCCRAGISIRYPAVELLTALLFLALAVWPPFGPPWHTTAAGAPALLATGAVALVLHGAFVAALVACTFIDFDHQILPDAITKPGMVVGLLAGLWPGLAGALPADPGVPDALRTLLASVFGLVAGAGSTWVIRALGSRVFGREAMGLGDVKFLGMIGAFLGWQGALLTLFLGCVVGAVVGSVVALRGGLGVRIPFGPYLAIGALLALFAQQPILHAIFVTWPDWQRSNPAAQWLLLAIALLCAFGLIFLVRRGRRAA
jgi:leader peptidase (prepilin peptidase)/N-methyltransferase